MNSLDKFVLAFLIILTVFFLIGVLRATHRHRRIPKTLLPRYLSLVLMSAFFDATGHALLLHAFPMLGILLWVLWGGCVGWLIWVQRKEARPGGSGDL